MLLRNPLMDRTSFNEKLKFIVRCIALLNDLHVFLSTFNAQLTLLRTLYSLSCKRNFSRKLTKQKGMKTNACLQNKIGTR